MCYSQDLDNLLEELLAWLEGLENTLISLESEPLPDDRQSLEILIADHREFMENTSRRQGEVDSVCKSRQIKPKDSRKITKSKSPGPMYVCTIYYTYIFIVSFGELWFFQVLFINQSSYTFHCQVYINNFKFTIV